MNRISFLKKASLGLAASIATVFAVNGESKPGSAIQPLRAKLLDHSDEIEYAGLTGGIISHRDLKLTRNTTVQWMPGVPCTIYANRIDCNGFTLTIDQSLSRQAGIHVFTCNNVSSLYS